VTVRPGHVSVITGGSSGIGRTIACSLAARGGSTIIVGRDSERLEKTLATLRAAGPGRHSALAMDLGQPDEFGRLEDALADYGRVDLLFAAAGLGEDQASGDKLPRATRDLALATFQRVIDVNLHSVFLAVKAVLPYMMAEGNGDLIAVASSTTPHGLRGRPLAPAYCSSKFALTSLFGTLAAELAEHGIRAHTLFPGPVETPLIADTMLHRPYGGIIAPENFAASVIGLLAMGGVAFPFEPHILPVNREPLPAGS
jgi:3-oxoacyl-[acyl-carrier protein] reductase